MVRYDSSSDPTVASRGMRAPAPPTYGMPAPAASTPAPAPAASAPPSMSNYFSDPLLQQYLDATRSAMGALARPTTVQNVPTSNATLDSAVSALTRLLSAGSPGFDYARPIVDQRIAELRQPGYSTSQLDQIRTQATNPLTAQRDAARQNVIQRFASQGFSPDSGIVQQALLDLDRQYAGATTQQDTSLAINAAQQDEQRKNQAAEMAAGIAPLANSGIQTQMSAASGLAGIGNAQQSAAFNNANLDLSRQQLDTNRLLQGMGLSQNLAQLPIQLQAQQIGALNALQGPVPTYTDPSISALMNLMGLGQGAANQSGQNTAALWASLIGAVPGLLGAFGVGKTK